MTYFILFITKFIENTLSTLRIIAIAHNHKWFGAFLNFVIAVVWSVSTLLIINDKSIISIFFFALGCFLGSLLGSYIEEKLHQVFFKS